MTVDGGNGRLIVLDADMIGLDPNDLAVLSMSVVNGSVPDAPARRGKQPQVRELCSERSRNVSEVAVRDKI